jgi:hypothetical protein
MTDPVPHDRCATCHVNVHRESIKDECKTCHTEASFKGGTFDHTARTKFVLDGKHVGVDCAKCHTSVSPTEVPLARKVVDYSGADRTCVACHGGAKDPHKGEFDRTCDSCHKTSTFDVKTFTHAGTAEFYRGSHEKVACEKCHVPARTPIGTGAAHPKPECATCHVDVHLGQVGNTCESCHTVDGAKFKALKFTHERSTFALTGKHETTECVKCHKTETRQFALGHGTAMVLKPMDFSCHACHADAHLGQVDLKCDTCHQTAAFKIAAYRHQELEDFFRGFHGKYACVACHKTETSDFPAGRGTTMRFKVGRACLDCHPK